MISSNTQTTRTHYLNLSRLWSKLTFILHLSPTTIVILCLFSTSYLHPSSTWYFQCKSEESSVVSGVLFTYVRVCLHRKTRYRKLHGTLQHYTVPVLHIVWSLVLPRDIFKICFCSCSSQNNSSVPFSSALKQSITSLFCCIHHHASKTNKAHCSAYLNRVSQQTENRICS